MASPETEDPLTSLREELCGRILPDSVGSLSERLRPLSVGLTHHCPLLGVGSRMFRIRKINNKPTSISEVGAPPAEKSPIGRLNDQGQSVLYLADSPDTAFAESGASAGEFCLSEWRVTAEKLVMANGGISPKILAERFLKEDPEISTAEFTPRLDSEQILNLFREIFTLDVQENVLLYRWSIACGMACGFSYKCDRSEAAETTEGTTQWKGACPFGGIAYPSVRTNRTSLNFSLNDHGRANVRLHNVQWVRRLEDGSYTSLDFADAWDDQNMIRWQNRPAKFQLKRGETAMITKIAGTIWRYETADGSIPWFA